VTSIFNFNSIESICEGKKGDGKKRNRKKLDDQFRLFEIIFERTLILAVSGSYPEFPDNCFGTQFPFLEYVSTVH